MSERNRYVCAEIVRSLPFNDYCSFWIVWLCGPSHYVHLHLVWPLSDKFSSSAPSSVSLFLAFPFSSHRSKRHTEMNANRKTRRINKSFLSIKRRWKTNDGKSKPFSICSISVFVRSKKIHRLERSMLRLEPYSLQYVRSVFDNVFYVSYSFRWKWVNYDTLIDTLVILIIVVDSVLLHALVCVPYTPIEWIVCGAHSPHSRPSRRFFIQ